MVVEAGAVAGQPALVVYKKAGMLRQGLNDLPQAFIQDCLASDELVHTTDQSVQLALTMPPWPHASNLPGVGRK